MSNGGINVAALGFGGIDTSSLVSGLMAVEQQPYNQLQGQQQGVEDAQSTISAFSNDLSALKSAASALSTPDGFTATSATSSDPSIVSTASAQALPGQWSVSVTNLAQEQRTLSNGASSSSDALGLSGNLGITLGDGSAATIAVAPTDSLSDIAGEIATSGLRVQASLSFDGSQYHLLVSGLDTGSGHGITFDESGLAAGTSGYTLGLSTAANTIQKAGDASLTVGGIPITSSTNRITGAIPGVTLAITQPTTTPATISIQADSSQLQKNVQAFVDAYNTVVNDGHTIAGFGTTKASNSLLQGDRGVRSTLDQLGELVGEAVPGTSGSYTTLASAGITLNDDGTLSLDADTLSQAVANDPDAVKKLFVTDASNGSTGVMDTIGNLVDSLSSGSGSTLGAEAAAFGTRSTQMGQQLTTMQQRMTAYQTQLQTEFTQMNTALAQYKQMASALGDGSSSSSSSGVL